MELRATERDRQDRNICIWQRQLYCEPLRFIPGSQSVWTTRDVSSRDVCSASEGSQRDGVIAISRLARGRANARVKWWKGTWRACWSMQARVKGNANCERLDARERIIYPVFSSQRAWSTSVPLKHSLISALCRIAPSLLSYYSLICHLFSAFSTEKRSLFSAPPSYYSWHLTHAHLSTPRPVSHLIRSAFHSCSISCSSSWFFFPLVRSNFLRFLLSASLTHPLSLSATIHALEM